MNDGVAPFRVNVLYIEVDVTALSDEQKKAMNIAMDLHIRLNYMNCPLLKSKISTVSLPNHGDCPCDLCKRKPN